MKKAEDNTQGQKARTSKLAVASAVISLVLCIGCVWFILASQGAHSETLYPFLFVFPLATSLLGPLAFLLGLWSLIKIKKSRGLLKGYIFGCAALLVSVVSWHYAMVAVGETKPEAKITLCQYNMMNFAEALRSYSNDYGGKYPTPDKWCDLLTEYKEWPEDLLRCPTGKGMRVVGGYALNPNATPTSASDVVLVFETNCDWERCWNRFGGAEILTFDNHRRPTLLPREGNFFVECCNILFNDGSLELIYPEQLGDLNWGDEPSNK